MANKPTKSLGARIAAALATNGKADRDTLTTLWTEAADEVNALQATIAAEETHLADIAADDPDKSTEVIASSRRRIERLTKVIHEELRPRVEALDRAADLAEWEKEAERLQSESDQLWAKLEATYNVACDQLIEVWGHVFRNSHAINEARRRRPSGTRRELTGADHPELRATLRLPYFDEPTRIRFPRDEAVEFQRATSNLLVEQAKAFERKQMAVLDGRDERVQAERIKHEQETKQRVEAERAAYHKSLQEADRKQRGVA